jgi:hypothetical protein
MRTTVSHSEVFDYITARTLGVMSSTDFGYLIKEKIVPRFITNDGEWRVQETARYFGPTF